MLADFQFGYQEFWSSVLKPWVNYVPLNGPASLKDALVLLDSNSALETLIAREARAAVEHVLHPEMVMHYWQLILDRLSTSVERRGLSAPPGPLCLAAGKVPLDEGCVSMTVSK